MSNIQQMEDNISYMKDFKPLNEEEQRIIQEAQRIIGHSATIPCTACHYCVDGCPKQIRIPDIFSAMNKGGTRSGNRGTCSQPCREEYKLYNNGLRLRSGHLLSPKDRDVSDYISRLIESGVASLKLEGRMRDENYVRSAVRSYRTLIDAYYYGILDDTLVREVKRDLLINFNRGGSYTSQYLSCRKDDNLLSGEYPGKYGYSLGKISRLDVKKGTVTVSLGKHPVIPSKGDRDSDATDCYSSDGRL